MKKFYLNLLTLIMVGLTSAVLMSCSDDSDDQSVNLELSGLDAPFAKEANGQPYAQELSITCNSSWVIEDKPDWLNISNLSGTGDKVVKVWPAKANNSAERRAVITVKSGDKSKEKEVVQYGVSSCYARPIDIVTMVNSCVFGYNFSTNIHHVCFILLDKIDANGLTDAEIPQSIAKGYVGESAWKNQTKELFAEHGNYFGYYGCEPNTSYVLISVAFDDQNEIGEINRTTITLPIDDIYHSPYIDEDEINASSATANGQLLYRIQSTKGSQHSVYANKYYSWAVVGTKWLTTIEYWYKEVDAIIAYLILQEIKKNPAPHDTYFNGTDRSEIRERLEGPVDHADFTLPANYINDKYLQIVHWCTLTNGDFSGRISDVVYDVSVGVSNRKTMSLHQQKEGKTPKLIQFDPKKLKQGYKVIRLD